MKSYYGLIICRLDSLGTQIYNFQSFWSLFKRGLYGTYHRMSVRHLGRYLTDFAGRRNDRDCDTAEQRRNRCGAWRGAWPAGR